jgi:hypothetical protein
MAVPWPAISTWAYSRLGGRPLGSPPAARETILDSVGLEV